MGRHGAMNELDGWFGPSTCYCQRPCRPESRCSSPILVIILIHAHVVAIFCWNRLILLGCVCVCLSQCLNCIIGTWSLTPFSFFQPVISDLLRQDAALLWCKGAYAPHVCQEVPLSRTYPPFSILEKSEGW